MENYKKNYVMHVYKQMKVFIKDENKLLHKMLFQMLLSMYKRLIFQKQRQYACALIAHNIYDNFFNFQTQTEYQ